MIDMKKLLESKVNELKEKLEAEATEKRKTESDVMQWKSMAQKELKTRLQVGTPRDLIFGLTQSHFLLLPAGIGEVGIAKGTAGGEATEPVAGIWASRADGA